MQYNIFQFTTQFALVVGTMTAQLAVSQTGVLAELPTVVKAREEAKSVQCLSPKQLPKGSEPSTNSLHRAVTVSIQAQAVDEDGIPKNNEQEAGSGVIIRRQDPAQKGDSYTYTVLTADHVVASGEWSGLNIFDPKFSDDLRKQNPVNPYIKAPVLLFTCDGKNLN
jgi:S1-C subfamily serine protease